MGLDCSHDAWSGGYASFNRWRQAIAQAAGLPPLDLMEGFYDSSEYGTLFFGAAPLAGTSVATKRERLEAGLPIRWGCLAAADLRELLNHSDCDGEIAAHHCAAIAAALEALIPELPDGDGGGHIGNWRATTAQFAAGLRAAAAAGEPLTFG